MAPVQAGKLSCDCAEPLIHAPQAADVLTGHAADQATPSFVGIFAHRQVLGDQRLSPLDDDPPFLPVRRADQPAPAADIRLRGLDQRIAERGKGGAENVFQIRQQNPRIRFLRWFVQKQPAPGGRSTIAGRQQS